MKKKNTLTAELTQQLLYLKLPWVRENYEELATQAAQKQFSHVEFLAHLIEGESNLRMDRATERRIKAARFPVIKTLEQFDWSWPKKINRPQVQNLFRLPFIEKKQNVIFIGGVNPVTYCYTSLRC